MGDIVGPFGFEGGLGVVLLAILLDRITQSFGTPNRQAGDSREGLLGRVRSALGLGRTAESGS